MPKLLGSRESPLPGLQTAIFCLQGLGIEIQLLPRENPIPWSQVGTQRDKGTSIFYTRLALLPWLPWMLSSSCPEAYGIFPDQGSNQSPLLWQADSYPLYHQGSPQLFLIIVVVLFTHQVISNSLQPRGLQHTSLPCPLLSLGVCLNPCPSSHWCHPTISFSVSPSPPALNLSQQQSLFQGVGSLNQVAKVLELQLQHQSFQWTVTDWFPLGLTGLISSLSKGLLDKSLVQHN